MTPAERVADAVLIVTSARDAYAKAIDYECVALETLRSRLEEIRVELEPACDCATKAANKANDVWLTAQENYVTAFRAATEKS